MSTISEFYAGTCEIPRLLQGLHVLGSSETGILHEHEAGLHDHREPKEATSTCKCSSVRYLNKLFGEITSKSAKASRRDTDKSLFRLPDTPFLHMTRPASKFSGRQHHHDSFSRHLRHHARVSFPACTSTLIAVWKKKVLPVQAESRTADITALPQASATSQRQCRSSIDPQTYAGQARRSSVASPLPNGCYLPRTAVLSDRGISCFQAVRWA